MEIRDAVEACFERLQRCGHLRARAVTHPSFLRALLIVYEQLEQQLQRLGPLAHAQREGIALKRRQLESELAAAHAELFTVDKPALHALVLAQAIRRRASDEATLLSYAQALDVVWQLTREPEGRHFDPQLLAADLAAAGDDARCVAEGVCRLLELFEESAHDQTESLRLLNLDAGTHPMPCDLREVEAALRAGEQTYREWAYYSARFGERGVRFTRSDSAWLAYVARRESHAARSMFDWLARLLASRGMPRLLFERHLEHLHAALVRAVPEHAPQYASLLRAAAELAAARVSLLPDLEALAQQFKPLGSPSHWPLTAAEAGRLLVAAVLDDRLGVANAVPSLVSWLGDAARFGDHWAQAVPRFLRHVHEKI